MSGAVKKRIFSIGLQVQHRQLMLHDAKAPQIGCNAEKKYYPARINIPLKKIPNFISKVPLTTPEPVTEKLSAVKQHRLIQDLKIRQSQD